MVLTICVVMKSSKKRLRIHAGMRNTERPSSHFYFGRGDCLIQEKIIEKISSLSNNSTFFSLNNLLFSFVYLFCTIKYNSVFILQLYV